MAVTRRVAAVGVGGAVFASQARPARGESLVLLVQSPDGALWLIGGTQRHQVTPISAADGVLDAIEIGPPIADGVLSAAP